MPSLGLRRVHVSFLLVCFLYAMAIVSAWTAGAMSDETFWRALAVGEASLVAERASRRSVLSRIASRRWAVRVAQLAVMTVAGLFAIVILVTAPIVVLDVFSPLPQSIHGVFHHRVLAPAFVALALVTLFLWENRAKKLLLIDEIGSAIHTTSECLQQLAHAVDIDEARAIGRRGMEALLQTMLRPHSSLRPQKSVRAAFLFVLGADGRFDIAFMYPEHREYSDLFGALRPAQWRPAEVDLLRQELRQARAQLRGQTLREREEEIKGRCESCASTTGYAYKYPGLHTYPDVTEEIFKSEAYLNCFAPQDRDRLAFRSKAAIRLQLGSRKVGVLVLTDSAVAGFMNPDKSPIELLSPLVALLFDRVWNWSDYN